MNNRITIALLTAALAAVGFYLWFDRERPGTQASALSARKLLPPAGVRGKPEPIDRIEIVAPNERLVLALVKDHGWRVLVPTLDRADPEVLRELIEVLETSLKLDAMPATPDALERCGLRDPPLRLTISRGTESPVELQIGARTAVEGRVYARLANAPEIVVIPEQVANLARRPTDGFRDVRLFDFKPADVVRIRVRNPWGDFALARDRGRWELTSPVPARADDKAVNDWLGRLCESHVQLFASADAGDLLSFGLMAPRGSVQLEFESANDEPARVVELQLGRRAEARYATDATLVRLPDRGLVAAVPLVIEEALLLEPDALREHTLFTLNPDLVDRIHIRPADKSELVLARQGEQWTLLQSAPAPVEVSEVSRLIKELPSWRVREFLTGAAADAAKAELAKPVLRVTFASYSSENTAESSAGETAIATVSFGPARPDESMLVQIEEDDVIARVDANLLGDVPTDPHVLQPLTLFESRPEIDSLSVQESGPVRTFKRARGVWNADGSAEAPPAVESAASLLSSLRAVRWIGAASADYGLETPTLVVRATCESGCSPIELKVGKQTGDGMWPASLAGRGGVFLLSDPDRQILAAPAR